ncbi:MAG TPA: class I SAM-dependent methyltransferase [Pirellulales bacterium]|jgi:SAM-dependent methyltransferase|nr:class I SAM-dependent methyltransferase [Pirellulales bacterium]
MSNIPNKAHFQSAYADKAPWDIAGPQPAFVQMADRIAGSVLDAGCGTGENALYFAERGHKVTGIDYLDEPIRRAKQKAAERGITASFLVMDALALGEMPEMFDSAIDSGLFHVFSDADRTRYVAGLASVIKPGGRLFLMCFSDEEPGTTGPRRVSQAELRTAFATGWEIESITPNRFQVIPEFRETFSPGGPKTWFVIARRQPSKG